jgi:hypothetical protein
VVQYRDASAEVLRYYPEICFRGLRKTMQFSSSDNLCPDQGLNLTVDGHKSEALL